MPWADRSIEAHQVAQQAQEAVMQLEVRMNASNDRVVLNGTVHDRSQYNGWRKRQVRNAARHAFRKMNKRRSL